MKQTGRTYLITFAITAFFCLGSWAQDVTPVSPVMSNDTIHADTLRKQLIIDNGDDINKAVVITDESAMLANNENLTNLKDKWIPNPKKALWLAIAFPGGGQIYNRKYWKLPLIYGGFLGCFYAISWNDTMYRDYSQAFVDIMDNDPNTNSYNNFLPPTYDVNANLERLQNLFKKKKNYYRRYRDMRIFIAIGVYALSVIDAYVDAELSSFDISKDLSMKVKPSVITDKAMANTNGNSYGLKCAIAF